MLDVIQKIWDEFRVQISSVIEALPPQQQLVLSLKLEHAMSRSEMAKTMKVSEEEVDQILLAAITAIRPHIDLE